MFIGVVFPGRRADVGIDRRPAAGAGLSRRAAVHRAPSGLRADHLAAGVVRSPPPAQAAAPGLAGSAKLTAIGNLLYYLCLASAIQRTGAPVSTMIIGTLPVVIALCANLFYGRRRAAGLGQAGAGAAADRLRVSVRERRRAARQRAADRWLALSQRPGAGRVGGGVLDLVPAAQLALAAGEPDAAATWATAQGW